MNDTGELHFADGYAVYRPIGECTLQTGAATIACAIEICRERRVKRLLVNTTGMTGFKHPTLMDRFAFASTMAAAAKGALRLALVCQPLLVSPDKVGVLVAADRGLTGEVFKTEEEAVAWLLQDRSDGGEKGTSRTDSGTVSDRKRRATGEKPE